MRHAALALALLLLAPTVFADCAPKKVLKIVTAAEFPGTPPDAFNAQPRTLYRLGDQYARLEEPLNKEDNIHGLIIVSEPDIWMINRTDMTAQHIVDPGPTIEFHAPILDAVDSKFWNQLEFGCEEPFMKAVKARSEKTASGGTKYTHAAEGTTVSLIVENGKPLRVDVANEKMQYGIRYLAFETVETPAADLFVLPKGVKVREARQP